MSLSPYTAYLLLALLAGVLYAASAVILRSAANQGAGSVLSTLACNGAAALLFTFFFDWSDWGTGQILWGPGLVLGMVFLAGQLFALRALEKGTASIATQVLSTKVIMVALIAVVFLGRSFEARVLIGGALSVVGVAALNQRADTDGFRILSPSVAYSLAAAVSLSIFDSLVAYWSGVYSFGRVVPLGMWCAALLSLVFFVWRPGPAARPGRRLAGGALLMGLQAICFISAIGFSGDAAACNVAYASRGLWVIVLAPLVGALWREPGLHRAPIGLWRSVVGGGCIFVAVCLVFL
jgi:drug/metabolite transporter (DMT)-like permease